jgi:hypothetical protein
MVDKFSAIALGSKILTSTSRFLRHAISFPSKLCPNNMFSNQIISIPTPLHNLPLLNRRTSLTLRTIRRTRRVIRTRNCRFLSVNVKNDGRVVIGHIIVILIPEYLDLVDVIRTAKLSLVLEK